MLNCPYKTYGCTFQAETQDAVDDHVSYITSMVPDDPEHPFRPEED